VELKKPKRTPSFTTRRRTQSFRKLQRLEQLEQLPPVEIQGTLDRKHELQSAGKKAPVRSWKTFYTGEKQVAPGSLPSFCFLCCLTDCLLSQTESLSVQYFHKMLSSLPYSCTASLPHSPPSRAKIKNAWSFTSTLPYIYMVWCLVKYQGQLYLYLTLTLSIWSLLKNSICSLCFPILFKNFLVYLGMFDLHVTFVW
jgi:hypothetical protein